MFVCSTWKITCGYEASARGLHQDSLAERSKASLKAPFRKGVGSSPTALTCRWTVVWSRSQAGAHRERGEAAAAWCGSRAREEKQQQQGARAERESSLSPVSHQPPSSLSPVSLQLLSSPLQPLPSPSPAGSLWVPPLVLRLACSCLACLKSATSTSISSASTVAA